MADIEITGVPERSAQNDDLFWGIGSDDQLYRISDMRYVVYPAGGDTGQVLVKASTDDSDVEWADMGIESTPSTATMVSKSLRQGSLIRTISYHSGWAATAHGPEGGALYEVVSKGTHDTVRGYSTVDEVLDHTLNNGNVALFIPDSGLLNVKQAGARGNGVDDDSAAIQGASDFSYMNSLGGLYIPKGSYVCSDIKIYSRQTYKGDGYQQTNLISDGDAPVLISANWSGYNGASPQGHCQIKSLRVTGQNSASNTNEIGILIRDYYSTIESVWVVDCGSHGIRFDHKNQSGSTTGGTLVENRIRDIECFSNYGDGISYGDDDNNALTDAHFDNIIVNTKSGSSNYGINIGSSAGCQINQVHIYGTPVLDGMRLANCFNTNVDGIYIENATRYSLSILKFQKHLNASNLSLGAEGGVGLIVQSGGAASNDVANITNVNYINRSSTLTGVAISSSGSEVRVVNLTTQTAGGTVSDSSGDNISILSDIDYRDGEQTISFDNDKFNVALAYKKEVATSGPQSVDFVVRIPSTFEGAIGNLNICLRSFWSGGIRVQYSAILTVLTKDTGDSPTVLLSPILSTASEFTSLPSVSTSATGPGDITVTLSFEASNTDARGVVGLTMANV
tara:strand:- start:22636 stop:24501 length:1866 start_codon:yes stop_codon:yes gene_type:complete